MYVIKWINNTHDTKGYLKEIIHGSINDKSETMASWGCLNEAKLFISSVKAKNYIYNTRTNDIFWSWNLIEIRYIHPLNIV